MNSEDKNSEDKNSEDKNSEDKRSDSGKRTKLMRDALLRELEREVMAEDKSCMISRLELVARKLVDKAVQGDIPAVKEIHDRIDGKSVQGTIGSNQAQRKAIIEWRTGPSASTTGRDSSSSPFTGEPSVSPAS